MTSAYAIQIFNRAHVRQHRIRAANKFSDHAFLFSWAADQILDRIGDIKKDFAEGVIIGSRLPANFADKLTAAKQATAVRIIDIDDREILDLSETSCDLIVSLLDLHTVNDLPGILVQIRRALRPDGLFLSCMFGGETLFELRESLMQTEVSMKSGASPRVFPFVDTPSMGDLLQRAGFALPVVDSEIIRVSYQTMFNLIADLRGMGESNALSARQKNFTPPGFFARAAEYYQTHFAEQDGMVTASFEVIFLLGWAPHESQQKPARRGSATHSLTEFLEE
jgi:SAM-dependent methyltransferase